MKKTIDPGLMMIKMKKIILIAFIGLVVILSGCIGGQDAQQGPYQVQITQVGTLSDCIKQPGSSEIKACTLINLEVKNNNVKSLDFKLVNEEVVVKTSRVLPDRYDKEVGLNDLCTHQAGMEFILTQNTQRNIGLCYPTINFAEEPTLKIETLINLVRHEYKFVLSS